jgi:hypothetical protein
LANFPTNKLQSQKPDVFGRFGFFILSQNMKKIHFIMHARREHEFLSTLGSVQGVFIVQIGIPVCEF